jgi:hypothetical protein
VLPRALAFSAMCGRSIVAEIFTLGGFIYVASSDRLRGVRRTVRDSGSPE